MKDTAWCKHTSTCVHKSADPHNRDTRVHTGSMFAKSDLESLNPCYQNNIQHLCLPRSQQELAAGGNQVKEMLPWQYWWLSSHMWIIYGESLKALWHYPPLWESYKWQNHLYSLSTEPSSISQNTPRKWALIAVKRDIWYQRDIKEVCCRLSESLY